MNEQIQSFTTKKSPHGKITRIRFRYRYGDLSHRMALIKMARLSSALGFLNVKKATQSYEQFTLLTGFPLFRTYKIR